MEHNALFYTLLVATILWVGICIAMAIDGEVESCIVGVLVGLILIGPVGFGLLGHSSTRAVRREAVLDVLHTPTTAILLKDGRPVRTYSDTVSFFYLQGRTNCVCTESGWVDSYHNTNWSSEYTLKQ